MLEHDLVDDPRARFPEADAVPVRRGAEELVDLAVLVERSRRVLLGPLARLDQVVAVDGRRHRDTRDIRLRELEKRHLGRRILHRHAVGAELEVALPGAQVGGFGVVEVAEEDLLGQRQRATQALAHDGEALGHLGVDLGDELG